MLLHTIHGAWTHCCGYKLSLRSIGHSTIVIPAAATISAEEIDWTHCKHLEVQHEYLSILVAQFKERPTLLCMLTPTGPTAYGYKQQQSDWLSRWLLNPSQGTQAARAATQAPIDMHKRLVLSANSLGDSLRIATAAYCVDGLSPYRSISLAAWNDFERQSHVAICCPLMTFKWTWLACWRFCNGVLCISVLNQMMATSFVGANSSVSWSYSRTHSKHDTNP